MKQLTIFRILTFILLPIAALIAFFDFFVITVALLANPPFLLFGFLLTSFVIYVIASTMFLLKGVDTGKPCKTSLRDWIKVNSYVSSFLGIMFLLNSVSIFFLSDVALRQIVSQLMETQSTIAPMPSRDLLIAFMKGMAYFMFFMSIILLVHIQINYRLLKKHAHLFVKP